MNFEEMLEARKAKKTIKARIPYGYFYKRLIDGKYSNFVEFHDEVADQLTFSRCVKADCEATNHITHKAQLHFTPNEGDDGVYALAVEVGNYLTLEQLVNDDPAIVAKNDFLNTTLRELFDIACCLNDQGIYHVCYAPSNVLVRKNDNAVRLLCHGSFYTKTDQDILYDGVENFVAPEVFSGGEVDGRTDVFSLGKLIEWLYNSSGMPFELKKIVDKATDADREERFACVEDMRNFINKARAVRRTAISAIVAVAVALTVVGLFFYLLPNPEVVEYVKPVEEPIPDEMVEDDIEAIMGIGADADSATIAHIVELQKHKKDSLGVGEAKLRQYNAKAEAIFRKQFAKAADEILSEVYNPNEMDGTEKDFAWKTKQMTEQLTKKQAELMKATTLSPDRAQAISSQIIEQLTEKKKAMMSKDYMGIKKQKSEQESEAKAGAGAAKKVIEKQN